MNGRLEPIVGRVGERVRLVPLDRQRHLDNAMRWLNDPAVTRWTLVGDLPLTRLAEQVYFDEAMRGEEGTRVEMAIETLADGEHIGFTGVHKIDWRHGVGHVGTLIGRADRWGQGYGTDAVRTRTRYAFEDLGLRMLIAEVLVGNEPSARMLRRAGFEHAATLPRRYWKRGAFRDAQLFTAERDRWTGAPGDVDPLSPGRGVE